MQVISELSPACRQFIGRHIGSVWQLELLLFFKNSTTCVSLAEASKRLYIAEAVLQPSVQRLADAFILKPDPVHPEKYCYAPEDGLHDTIAELETAYSQRRIAVINVIYAGPAQTFADAFRLSKDGDEEGEQ